MLIKKILNITISMLLLVSTSGVIINKHYSGDQLFSTSFFTDAESCCETSCCHHEHQNNCREESILYKLIVDYTLPDIADLDLQFSLDSYSIDLFCFHTSVAPGGSENDVLKLPPAKPPPTGTGLPILFHSLLL